MDRPKQTQLSPQVHAHTHTHTHSHTHRSERPSLICCVCFEDVSSFPLISRQFSAQGSFVSSNWSCSLGLPWKPVQKVLVGGLPRVRIRLAVMAYCNRHCTSDANRERWLQKCYAVYSLLFHFRVRKTSPSEHFKYSSRELKARPALLQMFWTAQKNPDFVVEMRNCVI